MWEEPVALSLTVDWLLNINMLPRVVEVCKWLPPAKLQVNSTSGGHVGGQMPRTFLAERLADTSASCPHTAYYL